MSGNKRVYVYSEGNVVLTKSQRDFYEDNGYLVIPNLVDSVLLDEMRQRFLDICSNKVESLVLLIEKDKSLKTKGKSGEYLVNRIQDFTRDEVLFKYCCYDNIVKIVEDLIGSDIIAIHTMILNKPPNASFDTSIHPPHQDMLYFPLRPAAKIVGVWTAMEKTDQKNGCLYVVPGSHKGALYEHETNPTHKLYHGVKKNFDNDTKVFLPMERGDTVFFHPLLLHGSGPNLTEGFRKAISSHFANTNCCFIDVKGTVQSKISEEIEYISRTRLGLNASIQDLWKIKSRLVKGDIGNFTPLKSNL